MADVQLFPQSVGADWAVQASGTAAPLVDGNIDPLLDKCAKLNTLVRRITETTALVLLGNYDQSFILQHSAEPAANTSSIVSNVVP